MDSKEKHTNFYHDGIEYFGDDDKEYNEYLCDITSVMQNLIKKLCFVADAYNIERDDVMCYFSKLLSGMVEVSTFSNFEVK